MAPELERYYRILLSKKLDSWAIEGPNKIQESQNQAARSGLTGSGVHLAALLGLHCEYRIRRPMLGHLESFEEACKALSIEPSESDYDGILKEVESTFQQRVAAGHQFVQEVVLRRGHPGGDWATPVVNAARSALADVKRDIELKKLEVSSRLRRQVPSLRDRVLEQISSVNAQGKRALGYPLFVTSEHKVLADLGQAPSTPEELKSCVQALGILLDQVNHSELVADLSKAGTRVPQGSMNRINEGGPVNRCVNEIRRQPPVWSSRDGCHSHIGRPDKRLEGDEASADDGTVSRQPAAFARSPLSRSPPS